MLDSELKAVSQLTDYEKRSLYDLLSGYFAQTTYRQFLDDMAEKHWIVIMRDQHHVIRGFSTLVLIDFEYQGKKQKALFSGDTIIHHQFWGTQTLPLIWCRLAGQLKRRQPSVPLYWFLIVKGYRTYRYLSVFAQRYFPHWQYSTPPDTQAILNQLASTKFASAYDAQTGIVRFEQSRGQLQQQWADIPSHMQHKPEVAFFLKTNPRYYEGDELVCITELSEANLKSHARRAFIQGLQESATDLHVPIHRQVIHEAG